MARAQDSMFFSRALYLLERTIHGAQIYTFNITLKPRKSRKEMQSTYIFESYKKKYKRE